MNVTTLAKPLRGVGGFFAMSVDTLMLLPRKPFAWREFVRQTWFVARVSLLPTLLLAMPFSVLLVFTFNILLTEFGAADFSGSGAAYGTVTQIGPTVTVLVVAGAGATAMCADLGARTIREEIDAMTVLGLNPLRRLVAPLMLAGALVAAFLNFVVVFVSIAAAYIFDLAALHGTKGSFFGSFTQFATTADFFTSEIKATVFGITSVMIAAYKGLSAKRGPTGVGEAVNQSVVITGIVLFALNLIITQIFFALVPQRTF